MRSATSVRWPAIHVTDEADLLSFCTLMSISHSTKDSLREDLLMDIWWEAKKALSLAVHTETGGSLTEVHERAMQRTVSRANYALSEDLPARCKAPICPCYRSGSMGKHYRLATALRSLHARDCPLILSRESGRGPRRLG